MPYLQYLMYYIYIITEKIQQRNGSILIHSVSCYYEMLWVIHKLHIILIEPLSVFFFYYLFFPFYYNFRKISEGYYKIPLDNTYNNLDTREGFIPTCASQLEWFLYWTSDWHRVFYKKSIHMIRSKGEFQSILWNNYQE